MFYVCSLNQRVKQHEMKIITTDGVLKSTIILCYQIARKVLLDCYPWQHYFLGPTLAYLKNKVQ